MKHIGDRYSFGSGTAGVIIAIEGNVATVRLDYYNTTRTVVLSDDEVEPAEEEKHAKLAKKGSDKPVEPAKS